LDRIIYDAPCKFRFFLSNCAHDLEDGQKATSLNPSDNKIARVLVSRKESISGIKMFNQAGECVFEIGDFSTYSESFYLDEGERIVGLSLAFSPDSKQELYNITFVLGRLE
jgi:hypothetical protein